MKLNHLKSGRSGVLAVLLVAALTAAGAYVAWTLFPPVLLRRTGQELGTWIDNTTDFGALIRVAREFGDKEHVLATKAALKAAERSEGTEGRIHALILARGKKERDEAMKLFDRLHKEQDPYLFSGLIVWLLPYVQTAHDTAFLRKVIDTDATFLAVGSGAKQISRAISPTAALVRYFGVADLLERFESRVRETLATKTEWSSYDIYKIAPALFLVRQQETGSRYYAKVLKDLATQNETDRARHTAKIADEFADCSLDTSSEPLLREAERLLKTISDFEFRNAGREVFPKSWLRVKASSTRKTVQDLAVWTNRVIIANSFAKVGRGYLKCGLRSEALGCQRKAERLLDLHGRPDKVKHQIGVQDIHALNNELDSALSPLEEIGSISRAGRIRDARTRAQTLPWNDQGEALAKILTGSSRWPN